MNAALDPTVIRDLIITAILRFTLSDVEQRLPRIVVVLELANPIRG